MGQRVSAIALPLICTRPEADEGDEGTKSDPASVMDRVNIQPRRTFQRRALLIGIRYKDNKLYGELGETHDGVDKFLKLLIGVYGYRKEDITVMKDDDGCVEETLQPTEFNIRRELKALVQGAITGDRFTLLFCGHSCQEKVTFEDHHEEDGYDEAIVTVDNKEILDNDLKEILVSPLPSEVTLTAIFDCCHAGTLLDLPHYHCNAVYVPWVSKVLSTSYLLNESPMWRVVGVARQMDIQDGTLAALRFPLAMTLPDRKNVTSPHHGHYLAGRDYLSSHENLTRPFIPTSTYRATRTPPPTPSTSFVNTFNTPHVADPPISVPKSRVTHPPASKHAVQNLMYDMHPDGLILLLPGGPSTVDTDVGINVGVERGCDLETQRARISLHEAERLRIATQSPTAYLCDEKCRERENLVPRGEGTPTVISLGSCADPEQTWEGPQLSMTHFLCEYLSQLKDKLPPTYEELMIHIHYKLHQVGQKLHEETRDYKKKQPMGPTNESDEEPFEGEMNNFQSPCLSSLSVLNMHDKFVL